MNQLQLDFSAKARKNDPVQSHAATDRMNATVALSQQRKFVLHEVKVREPCTAKVIDGLLDNRGIAHRRMRELEKMGLVRREQYDHNGKSLKEMLCYLTPKGEQFLKDKP